LKVKVQDIRFVRDLYPRFELDQQTVNLYMLNLDGLPPIIVNKDLILVDGYHRLTAVKASGREYVDTEVLDVPEDQILVEAIKRNSIHGKQLTQEEKRSLAVRLYSKRTQEEIAKILAIDQSTVSKWFSRLEEARREEQRKRVLDLYLRGCTQQEIADKIGRKQGTIAEIIGNMKFHIESEPPVPGNLWLYTYRMIPSLGNSLGYAGNLPAEIFENVLYYYTEPFDMVVDPMAGGGTLIDACRRMYRRYRAYDLRPVREDIGCWDISKGYPEEAKGCDLVFLDPPYYIKKADSYPSDSASSLDRGGFLSFMKNLAENTFKTLRKGGVAAVIFGDYLDYEDETKSIFAADIFGFFKDSGFTPIMRVQLPLSSEQWSGSSVEKAKKEKRLLSIARDLYIFRRV
jgi:hypothetical protein